MNNNLDKNNTQAKKLRTLVLIISGMAAFITPFLSSGINIAMPFIARNFSLSAVNLSWVNTIYQLAAAVFLVPFGRLADIVGRRKILKFGFIASGFGSFLAVTSWNGTILIASRFIQGFGAAMIFGTSVAILTSVFPPGERGRALGITTAITYVSLSAGPVLGGFLVKTFSWRSIFWFTLPVILVAILLVLVKLKGEWAESRGEKFDSLGSIIFGLGIASLMFGFSRLPSAVGLIFTFSGIAGAIIFVIFEMKIENPVLDLNLFRKNRIFAFSNLAALINYSSTFAIGFLMSLYLQYIKGFPPHKAGLVIVAQPVVMALASPFAGRLSDRFEPRLIASAGMALTCLGLFCFSFLTDVTPVLSMVFCLIVLGFGFGLFSSPNTNAVMGSVDRKTFGVASATLGTMRLSGQMFSAGITMMIFSLFMGKSQITPAIYPLFLKSVRTAFAFYAAICFLGIFASFARGRRNQTFENS